jgi:Mn2+/Fe2+ NRAMP family transporter
LAHLNWHVVLINAVSPTVNWHSKDQIILICAILGTTISPYLFFWQTSQEIEEETLKGQTTLAERKITTKQDIKEMRIDTWSGMLLSNVAMFFIIAACAGTLFVHGITNITSAAQAAQALRPFAGNLSYFLFAIGIIGVGMLAIPVLAGSASYAFGESFGWKTGLYRPLRQARSFYGIIIFSMLVGLAMNFIGLDPIKALIYSAVANGVVAPIIILLIVLLGRNKKVMGEFVNGWSSNILGWIVVFLMLVAGGAAIYSLF